MTVGVIRSQEHHKPKKYFDSQQKIRLIHFINHQLSQKMNLNYMKLNHGRCIDVQPAQWTLRMIVILTVILNGLTMTHASAQTTDGPSFPKGYNNMSILYRNIDIEDYNMNGFGFEWIHGFSVSEQYPVYIETGAGLNMGLKNEGSGSWGGYGYINVPINGAYRFTLPNSAVNLSPFLGLELKGNVVGTRDIASDTQEWFSESEFKRFQMGWHIGCSLNYNKLHASISYGTDIIKIAKKTDIGTFSIGIGFNF